MTQKRLHARKSGEPHITYSTCLQHASSVPFILVEIPCVVSTLRDGLAMQFNFLLDRGKLYSIVEVDWSHWIVCTDIVSILNLICIIV